MGATSQCNNMNGRPNIILIEDTQVLNSSYSIIIERLLTSQHSNHLLIFWRSPGYEWLQPQALPILSLIPQYTYKKYPIKHLRLPRLLSFLDNQAKKWNHTMLPQFNKEEYIDLSILCNYEYKNSRIGQATSSLLLRNDPEVNCRGTVKWSIASHHMNNISRAIDTISYLAKLFDIRFFYQSESVYYSYALTDYAISMGIAVPYLLTHEGPLVIKEKHRCKVSEIGPSPRKKASITILDKNQTPSTNSLRYSIAQRIKGKETHNNTTASDVQKVDDICENITKTLSCKTVTDSGSLNNLLIHNTTAILYLHAATDGMYLHGYSGYPRPHDFFVDVCTKLSTALCGKINIIIRPHPNLFWGETSPYPSHCLRAHNEAIIFDSHIHDLLLVAYEVGANPIIVTASMKLHELFCIPGAIHISHHGTVLNDAYAYRLKIIATEVSMLYSLLDITNCLFVKPDTSIDSYIRIVTQTRQERYLDNRRLHAAYQLLPYCTDYFKNLIKPLSRVPFAANIEHLDEYIYIKGLSWNSPALFQESPAAIELIDSLVRRISCEASDITSLT